MPPQIEDFDLPDLPEGWAETTMGVVAQVVGGGTPDSKDPANFSESGGYPWLTPADLSNNGSMYVSRGKRNLTDQGLRTSSAKLMATGSVLLSSRAPIGYVAVAANPISTNQGFKSFVCAERLQPEFVAYWLRYIRALLERMGSGTTFSEISGSRAKQIPLHFAPLAEQKRIVAKIDALLARVDAARARLAKVPAILKRFRQCVLAAACSGRLTADWRESNAGSLTASDWCESALKVLLREPLRNGHSAKKSLSGSGIRTLTLSAVTYGDFSERNTKLTVADPAKVGDLWLQPGDIFIERSNTPELVGTARLYRGAPKFAIFPDLLIRIRVNQQLLPEYLELSLQADGAREYFMTSAQGTAGSMPKIDQGVIEKFSFAVPPLPEQREIVRQVKALFKLADAIEKRVAMATKRAENLTQSILAKAFRGELVPTEADLARRDGRDYESAGALLARISVDRHQRTPPSKQRATRGQDTKERALPL